MSDLRLYFEQRDIHGRAPVEIDIDVRAATARLRADVADACDRTHRLLELARDLDLHLRGRPGARVDADLNARETDMRKQRHREAEDADDAGEDRDEDQERNKATVLDRPFSEPHDRPARPSCRP